MKETIKVVGTAVEAAIKAPGVQTLEDNPAETKEVGVAPVDMTVATEEALVVAADTEMALVARHPPWDHMIRAVMEVDLCDKVEIVEAPWVVETDQLVHMVHPEAAVVPSWGRRLCTARQVPVQVPAQVQALAPMPALARARKVRCPA